MKKILLILFCFPFFGFTQVSKHILRSTVSQGGSSIELSENILLQQSTAQRSPVGVRQLEKHVFRQGFIQPSHLNRMLAISASSDLFVEIFPNPTNDKITLAFNELMNGVVGLSFYDNVGRLVFEENVYVIQPDFSFSISNLAVGNYFLKVNIANRQYVTQISKQ